MKKILIFLLAIGSAAVAYGYEFQVSPVAKEGPLGKKQHRMDENGEYECGVLLINTKIPNIKFNLSGIGGCGVEKTKRGYAVYLGRNTTYLTLTAPGFKSLRWDLSLPGGIQNQQYTAKIAVFGQDPATFSDSNTLKGVFKQNETGLYSRFAGKGKTLLKINTDLPFATLEETLLRPGSYAVRGEQTAAPYYLLIPSGTALGQVLRQKRLAGKIPWDTVLKAPEDYQLDLSWGTEQDPNQLLKEVKKQVRVKIN